MSLAATSAATVASAEAMAASAAMGEEEARAGSRTGRPSCTSTPTVPAPRSCRGSHAFGSWQGSWRTARRAERGEASSAQARVGCRGGGLQARREARVRGRDGAAARAYIEHVNHARDLRDVPVQGLVEAGGVLPGAERREARDAQARVRCAAAAGCRQGKKLACGGAMEGSKPGRTWNMSRMLVTCATSQSRGWLKLEASCQVRRGGGEGCSGARGVQRRRAAGKAGGSCAVVRWGSGPRVPRT